VRFCELAVKNGSVKAINLTMGFDNDMQRAEAQEKFEMLQDSLKQNGIEFKWNFSPLIHDRAIKLDNGWIIKIGRGLDIYQRPENWFSIGSNDFELRPCLETMVDIFRA
jgi:ATP-dependent Lon protease